MKDTVIIILLCAHFWMYEYIYVGVFYDFSHVSVLSTVSLCALSSSVWYKLQDGNVRAAEVKNWAQTMTFV